MYKILLGNLFYLGKKEEQVVWVESVNTITVVEMYVTSVSETIY